jgi:hypothetical protein
MATEVQTKTGDCPTHGAVEGTREIPRIQFPWVVTAVMRSFAARRPYVCPTCGQPVQTS